MSNTNTDIINELKKRGAFLMPAADISEIDLMNEDLLLCNICSIPDDYIRLLEKADGMQGPGFTLYGINPQLLAGGQIESDIFIATDEAMDRGIISDGLMLGNAQGNTVIIYSKEDNEYQILDRVTQDVLYRYKNIEDFIIARMNLHDRIISNNSKYTKTVKTSEE